jgi:hypothetical protein
MTTSTWAQLCNASINLPTEVQTTSARSFGGITVS